MGQVGLSILERSLRCFKRPVVWAAIVILLLNDHYLKGAYPSWWTGKLSDVAGLFFFPFIVTAVLGGFVALVGWEPFNARGIGRFAFVLVGVWFALMKVNPAVNGLTIAFWEWLVKAPVFIVMDVSDLIALPILIPAWKLWQRQLGLESRQQQRKVVYDWWVWLVMGTAVFGAMASSCGTVHTIRRIIEVEGFIYAIGGEDGYNVSFDGDFFGAYGIFARYDPASKSWDELGEIPEGVDQPINKSVVALPLTKCVPDSPLICYRIDGDERILESGDGGESWNTAWEVPPGRRLYMSRNNGCGGNINMGPYDLLITGAGVDYQVFAAAGDQGALVRNSDGSWERQIVVSAYPAPFSGSDFDDVTNTAPAELSRLFLFVLLIAFLHYVLFVRRTELLIALAVLLLLVNLWVGLFVPELLIFVFVSQLFAIFILGGIYRVVGDKRKIKDSAISKQAVFIWLGSSIGLLIVGFMLISLWVFAIIPYYSVAVLLIDGVAIIVAFSGIWANYHLLIVSREKVTENQTSETNNPPKPKILG